MTTRTLSLMLAICLAALLAACTLGADDADTTATPPPASDASDAQDGPVIAWAQAGDR
jgi:hypothetical protein